MWIARLTVACALIVPAIAHVQAQTYAGATGDTRIVVGYQARPELLAGMVPPGWEPMMNPAGPLQGANLAIIFIDRVRDVDAEGKSKGSPKRMVVFAVTARHRETGRITGAIAAGWVSHASDVPGFYQVYRQGSIEVSESTRSIGGVDDIESEWRVRDASGRGSMDFHLRAARDPKARTSAKVEAFPMSGKDAAINRIYRQEFSTDVAKSHSAGVDQVREISLRVSDPALGRIFDGSERLVGVLLVPHYYRHVYLKK